MLDGTEDDGKLWCHCFPDSTLVGTFKDRECTLTRHGIDRHGDELRLMQTDGIARALNEAFAATLTEDWSKWRVRPSQTDQCRLLLCQHHLVAAKIDGGDGVYPTEHGKTDHARAFQAVGWSVRSAINNGLIPTEPA